MQPTCCPFCGSTVSLVPRSILDPAQPGFIYLCNGFPHCDAHVNCHRGSIMPMGTLADANLRRWRARAHQTFDRMWRTGKIPSRTKAYQWLAQKMNLPLVRAHFGQFDQAQCQQVIRLIYALLAEQDANVDDY